MTEPTPLSKDIDRLLQSAGRARRLADVSTDKGVAEALRMYARQCERELAELIDAEPLLAA